MSKKHALFVEAQKAIAAAVARSSLDTIPLAAVERVALKRARDTRKGEERKAVAVLCGRDFIRRVEALAFVK